MSKAVPFYYSVTCEKVKGGKRPLWHARKEGVKYTGAGNTADNAIKDLQAQINRAKK